MPSFTCLYFLQHPELQLLEIKRIDLSDDAEAGERFKWLRITPQNLVITPLHFAAMDAAGVIEERYFLEGYLKFDDRTGTYIEKFNSAQYPLIRVMNIQIPAELELAIESFLALMPTVNTNA